MRVWASGSKRTWKAKTRRRCIDLAIKEIGMQPVKVDNELIVIGEELVE